MNDKTAALALTLAVSPSIFGGCASLSTRTGFALVATQTEAGLVTEVAAADKHGQACSHNVLGIVTYGDSSIQTAKAKAGITNVAAVDYEFLRVLVFYGRVCTIVHGT